MILSNNDLAPNGFVGLSQFDEPILGGNYDGFITQADGVWSELLLWNDFNADGICQDQEVFTLLDANLRSLEIIPRDVKRFDEHGNWLRFWAKAHRSDPIPRNLYMVDVFFQVLDR